MSNSLFPTLNIDGLTPVAYRGTMGESVKTELGFEVGRFFKSGLPWEGGVIKNDFGQITGHVRRDGRVTDLHGQVTHSLQRSGPFASPPGLPGSFGL